MKARTNIRIAIFIIITAIFTLFCQNLVEYYRDSFFANIQELGVINGTVRDVATGKVLSTSIDCSASRQVKKSMFIDLPGGNEVILECSVSDTTYDIGSQVGLYTDKDRTIYTLSLDDYTRELKIDAIACVLILLIFVIIYVFMSLKLFGRIGVCTSGFVSIISFIYSFGSLNIR